MEWYEILISILSGLAATIPLVVKLVSYVEKAIKEKNWSVLLNMLMGFMQEAEDKFETGADKKEWVMGMIKSSANTIQYDADFDQISALIDSLCGMAKKVNVAIKKD